MSVNATGCAPTPVVIPDHAPGLWSEPLGTATRAPSANEPLPPHPSPAWRAGLGRALAGPLTLGDSVIVAMGLDRNLTLLDRQTGDRVWRKRLNAPGADGPIVADGRIFVATGGQDGRVFAYSIRGKERWERRMGPVSGPLAATGDLVIAVMETGVVGALAMDDGAVRWLRRLPRAARAGAITYRDDVLVCSEDSMYRLRATDGEVLARGALPGTAIAPPARRGDTVVVATADGYLGALDAQTLRTLWTRDLNSPVFGGPAIARDSVFAVTLRGDTWRIPVDDPTGGDAMPVGAFVRAPVAPVRDGVLIGTLGGEILLVRGDSVLPLGRAEGPIEQQVLVRDGTMLVVDGRGRVHAWR